MEIDLELAQDGEEFVIYLTRSQALAMHEALISLRHRGDGDHMVALRLGSGPEVVDSIIERLRVDREEPFTVRFRWEELHTVHSALTSAATMFMSRGRFLQEPFHIRIGFFRENLDAPRAEPRQRGRGGDGMRHRISLTRDGKAFIARISPAQAEAYHRALSFLRSRNLGEAALTVQLGAGVKAVDTLTERLAGRHEGMFELRFIPEELHILHSALTAAAVMFLERELTFYRENFDAMARGIVEAIAKV